MALQGRENIMVVWSAGDSYVVRCIFRRGNGMADLRSYHPQPHA
jgi:hypothetical protein